MKSDPHSYTKGLEHVEVERRIGRDETKRQIKGKWRSRCLVELCKSRKDWSRM